MDITKTEDVQNGVNRTVEWTKETGAALGGVINSAGVGKNDLVSPRYRVRYPSSNPSRLSKIIDRKGKISDLDTWNLTNAVNVTGTYNLTRLALEHLVHVKPEETPDGERGVIIMISSQAAVSFIQPPRLALHASSSLLNSISN